MINNGHRYSIISKSDHSMRTDANTTSWLDTTSSSLKAPSKFINQQHYMMSDIDHGYTEDGHRHQSSSAFDVGQTFLPSCHVIEQTNYYPDSGNLMINSIAEYQDDENVYNMATQNHMIVGDSDVHGSYEQQNGKQHINKFKSNLHHIYIYIYSIKY